MSLKKGEKLDNVPEKSLEMPFQGQLPSLIKGNPQITYSELAAHTGRKRKTVQRHLQTLQKKGLLPRLGSAKGWQWEVVEPWGINAGLTSQYSNSQGVSANRNLKPNTFYKIVTPLPKSAPGGFR
jgi:hypothetical protein